jgi:drug/metabolite transporter (DMT)-like permease
VLAIVLALVASCLWGTSDFAAGLITRRLSVTSVIVFVQSLGLVAVSALLLTSAPPAPTLHEALSGVGAGLAGVLGLAALYRALAIGTMSTVAPIAATGVALPVLVGLLGGDAITAAQAVGLTATVSGVVLASRPAEVEHTLVHSVPPAERARRASIALAIVAAFGFGGYFIGAHTAARGGVLWLLVLSHLAVVPVALVAALTRRWPQAPPRRDAVRLIGVGVLDLGATALYAAANRHGTLTIVAVAGSLYPLATLALARTLLGERLAPLQGAGVAAALAGVVLLAAG